MVIVQERELWMDRLRGVAVLLVIVWHAVSIPTFFGQPMPATIQLANDALSAYRIPALLVLSGLLLRQSLRKPLGRYYWGKLANIVWPFLVWSAIYLLSNPGVDGASLAYWLGGSYLWYLVVVAFCYAIGPLVRWVPAVAVAAALIVVFVVWSPSTDVAVSILTNAPYFFVGAAVEPFAKRLLRAPWWIVAIGLLIAVGWAVYGAVFLGYAPRIHPIGLPVSLIGIFCLAWLVNRPARMAPFEWVGRHSLQFYVAHFPAMVIACRLGAAELPHLMSYAVLFLVGIGAAVVMSEYFMGTLLFTLTKPQSAAASRVRTLSA